MIKSSSISELAKAFVKTQNELKQPLKDASNPFFKSKYVPLENVVDSITHTASKNGLAFSQFPSQDESGVTTVGTIVMHESGEWIEYDPIKIKPVKNDPQAVGSAITYAKRYALSAIFGITSDQDDDGNEASKPAKREIAKQSPKIDKTIVKSYKEAIKKAIDVSGKADGSITQWFLQKLNVAKIEDITLEQTILADKLIEKLLNSANK